MGARWLVLGVSACLPTARYVGFQTPAQCLMPRRYNSRHPIKMKLFRIIDINSKDLS